MVSFFVPFVLPFLDISKGDAKKTRTLLKVTPIIVIVASVHLDDEGASLVGRTFQRIALHAYSRGMAIHPMVAPGVINNYRAQFKTLLRTDTWPLMMFRIGYPKASASKSPRIPVERLIIEN